MPLGLTAFFPVFTPNKLSLIGFEKRLNHGVVVVITFAAHRGFEHILGHAELILVKTTMRSAVRMVNAALRRLAQS